MNSVLNLKKFAQISASLLACACLGGPVSAAPSFDWPQWRGPNRDDVSKETGLLKNWPTGGPKRVWLYENAGHGYSGPSIVDGKLFTMGTRDDAEVLLALDTNTGKELWFAKIGNIFTEVRGNGPRATPTVDGSLVYAMGGEGKLICANVSDGKIVWQQHMKEDLGGRVATDWGYTESVLVDGGRVVCTPGGSRGTLAALDKKTGKLLWRSKEFTDPASYSSIIPVDLNGARQYIQYTDQNIVGINAADGKLLWKSSRPARIVITTPIYRDGYVYVASDYGAGCKMIKIGPDNAVTDVYENRVMKNHHGGVILVGDHLYGYSGSSGWVCQNFKTGEEVWVSKSLGKGAVAYASGMLYCLDESRGTVALAEASPKGWQEHGRFRLEPQSSLKPKAGIWVHPVIGNGKLYLRDQNYIYCYDVKRQ